MPGSVATMERPVINGLPQAVWLRGLSEAAPLLVLLHGGPGASEAALFRHFNATLERHFVVVYWEQRGAGRSYSPAIPPETMTLDQFVADLDALVDWLRTRFGPRPVVLLGHSWGSAVGLLYAQARPERVAAYVGTGQVADMPEGERRSYAFAVAEAAQRGHRRASEALGRIGTPSHGVDAMLTSRAWVERFGGAFHAGRLSTGALIWAALQESEVGLWDLVQFGRGNRFSLEPLWPEFSRLDLTKRVPAVGVPVIFVLGRHDRVTPSSLAAEYLAAMRAPAKRLVWLEESAHNGPFEQPAAFNRVLIEEVLPVPAGGG